MSEVITGHVTIEKTAKKFKLQSLSSSCCVILGFILAANESPVGALLLVGGVCWYVTNRVRIWWNHG